MGQGAPGARELGNKIYSLAKPGPEDAGAAAEAGAKLSADAPAQAVWRECRAEGKGKVYAGKEQDCPGGKGKRVSRTAASIGLGPKEAAQAQPGQPGEAQRLMERLNALGGEGKAMP